MHILPRIVFEEKEDEEGKRETRRQIAPSVQRQDRAVDIFAPNIDFVWKDTLVKHGKVLFHLFGVCHLEIQSNLCTTTTLGTPIMWPLLTGSHCSEATLCYKN